MKALTLTFLRNCSLAGSVAAGLYTREENSPNPSPGGTVPAPSSGNPSCPILMDADSLETAKVDFCCPANDVHLQDLLKGTAEISDLQNDGISGFRSLAIKGLQ